MGYGDCAYGRFRYGDDACSMPYAPGHYYHAKEDTIYLAASDTASRSELATDLSQYANSLTAGASGCHVYETAGNADRFAVAGPREIALLLDVSTTTTGYIAHYNDAAESSAFGLEIYESAGSVYLRAYVNNGASGEVQIPDITSTARRCAVAWLAFRDSGGDIVHLLCAYNTETETYRQEFFTEDEQVIATGKAWNWGARTTAGADLYGGTIRMVRFSYGRPHSPTEWFRDFVEPRSAPATTGTTRVGHNLPDRDSGIGDHGMFAGPVHAETSAAVRDADMRTVSPVVNEVYRGAPTWTNALASANWEKAMPGVSTHTMLLPYLRRRPISRVINRWRSKIWATVAATSGTPETVEVYVVSMSRLPTVGNWVANKPAPPSLEVYYDLATLTAGTHVSDTTDPRAFGLDGERYSYFALALRVRNDGGNAANTTVRIHAWHVWGLYVQGGAGPLDDLALGGP